MKKKSGRLWSYFVLIVFVIMIVTAFIMMGVAGFLYRLGHLKMGDGNPLLVIGFLLLISVLIGTVISLVVARKILKPVTNFSKAAEEVSRGNFHIRLDEADYIAEIRELSHNFNLMVKELSSIETLRNDFLVNVSHEFKTPIASIEGYAMLLQENDLPVAEREEYTRIIIDSARQLATLSGNILNLSKLENQELVNDQNPFRLDEQIRQAVLMLEPEWSRKELDLQIDLEKVVYLGNENLLWQVWTNLLGNAVKFTPQSGKIEIALHESDTQVVARITDTGCGMSKDVQKRIFDKFFQGDSTRKSDGNGLGLALVKRILVLCAGKITVKSTQGKGSIFAVILEKTPL